MGIITDDAWEKTQEELAVAGRSDGLPMVPPTPERIERMLKPHGFRPDIVVAGGVGIKAAYVPTWSGGTRAVSRPVPGKGPSTADTRR